MSRKDYQKIAEGTKNLYTRLQKLHDYHGAAAIEIHAEGLCEIFKADNPRFNRDKFLEACGFRERVTG